MSSIQIKKFNDPIRYGQKILFMGSCFTEHIGNALGELKFDVLQNPHGILFDPASVCNSLTSYIENKQYRAEDFFQLQETWHSWAHHSRFSSITPQQAINKVNQSQADAHAFLAEADWIIITLGSSFSYRLTEDATATESYTKDKGVANCHRAPAAWFNKHMLSIEETIVLIDTCVYRLKKFNPKLRIIFTISPVRHLRDGAVDNNRSKARLIEAVHHMVNKFDGLYYFPAYELVIDVLRDYRFYDIDLAHPNYMATEFVMEKFTTHCIDADSQALMQEVKKMAIARKHRPMQPNTEAHKNFLRTQADKARQLMEQYSFLNLKEELAYFEKDIL